MHAFIFQFIQYISKKQMSVNIWSNEKKIAPSVGFEPTRVNPIDF